MTDAIVLGNTAKRINSQRFGWVFYIRGSTQYVESAVVHLHPTFENPVCELSGPTFELEGSGWGTFELDVLVRWKTGSTTTYAWELQFAATDKNKQVAIPTLAIPLAEDQQRATQPSQSSKKQRQCNHDTNASVLSISDSSESADLEKGTDDGKNAIFSKEEISEVEISPIQTVATSHSRDTVCADLMMNNGEQLSKFLQLTDPLFMHGRGYSGPLRKPQCTWVCKKPPRDDHKAPVWLTASEFQDDSEILVAKCRQLATLMQVSRKTVVYTGAGISAAVIGQAARSGENKVGWKTSPMKAMPTLTHHVLGFLGQKGLIHSWVQQNHDGLPQKGGFPQERINEIHGSWYDPSNPVVLYSGNLHDRAYPWMKEDADTADLVLVLGTSLGGLNADQVATKTAKRSLIFDTDGSLRSLGTVCINLQQTEQDGKMTLRLFGKSDDVLAVLLRELGFQKPNFSVAKWETTSRVLVPYDADGFRLPEGSRKKKMWLDLRNGQSVRITPGHNIQGSQQPVFMHIGATKPVKFNGVTTQPGVGVGTVAKREEDTASFVLRIEGATMCLGIWWLEAAQRGGVAQLPVVNVKPEFA